MPARTTFGPSALLTPANGITVLRLLATPVVIALIMLWGASWFTFVFGGLLAMSDGIDGWLARKQGTTRSGAFLDPLADKVVVLGALVALVAKGIVWWLPVAIIAIREIAMSVYRSVVGRHGISIPARNSAKLKTLLQDIAIGMCLAPPLAGHESILAAGIWVATGMTVFTGAQYFVDGTACGPGPGTGRRGLAGQRVRRRHELGGLTVVRVEIVAVGTELLLGQIADTNSKWLGEHLAAIGVASHFHQAVGDNHERIVLAFRTALARSDGVIVCGGLGPTHDDITREAIAEVMNVPLHRDEEVVDRIRAMFNSRGRVMSDSNLRQADVPDGATVIPQTTGTAPGLICPVGHKVVYAVPGVPYEMAEMFERAIAPDLTERLAERGETAGVIASRVIRTWGMTESALAETLAAHIAHLDGAPDGAAAAGGADRAPATVAFLASGIEGIKVRVTVRADDAASAAAALDTEEQAIRRILHDAAGDVVFGIDDEAIEDAVARTLAADGLTLGLAESLTGGLAASRLVNVPGASRWFRGSVVSYASEVKFDVLGVPEGPVVSEAAARAMAEGARSVLGADVGLSMTGVAGPDSQDDQPPGTVFVGLARSGRATEAFAFTVPGDRDRVRQYATIAALDLLRRTLGS